MTLEVLKICKLLQIFLEKAISSTSTGAPHALSYYLSSKFNLYHGISVIIWLPTILEYNFKNLDRLDKTKKGNY